MEIPEECKGCLTSHLPYETWKSPCVIKIPTISSTVKCPCIDCLLKMVCEEECERFNLYKKVSKLKYKVKKGDISNG